MCRIVGLLNFNDNISDESDILIKMRDSMTYGGPDDCGIYKNNNYNVLLGHRRLSIIDLSSAAHQPMKYENLVITYNGEIYNYLEIRNELENKYNFKFKTNSDTEVILAAFKKWGLDSVKKFHGMFAFAIWDTIEEKLYLCRDRMGIKPLYWFFKNDLFLFSSEIKAFHFHPKFDRTIDKSAAAFFLQLGYIPCSRSIFTHVKKIEPGSFLIIDKNKKIKTIKYWDIEEKFNNKIQGDFNNEDQIAEELEEILTNAFKLRMVADVPVGIFLSGGVDSSLVASLIQKESTQKIKTFTIGFEDINYDESNWAKQVADHIGTDHTELVCNENDFKNIIQELPEFYDEPFGDTSAIPTYIVSKLAKEKVKVALSADGADEAFGGYDKYRITVKIFSILNKIPVPLRKTIYPILTLINPVHLEKFSHLVPFLSQFTNVKDKFFKFRNSFCADSIEDFFFQSSKYINPNKIKKIFKDIESTNCFNTKNLKYSKQNIFSYLGINDMLTYLPDDILVKVDRASMQVALEAREPFLDQDIIEYSMNIPDKYKFRNNKNKYILRKILHKYVPAEIVERPKKGFGVPIYLWLKELRSEIEMIPEDKNFIQDMGISQSILKNEILSFFLGKGSVNAHFVWFVFILWKWYRKWIRN